MCDAENSAFLVRNIPLVGCAGDGVRYCNYRYPVKVNKALRAVLSALILVFVGLLWLSLRDTSAKEGGTAPEFAITTDQGNRITPRSFGGKVLVLNFWASWCLPCLQEIPSLNQLQKEFANSGLVVVAVSIDKNDSRYKKFLTRIPVVFQTTRDGNADISTEYGTTLIPETYIIQDGRLMRKFPNAENWMSDDITQYVRSLL